MKRKKKTRGKKHVKKTDKPDIIDYILKNQMKIIFTLVTILIILAVASKFSHKFRYVDEIPRDTVLCTSSFDREQIFIKKSEVPPNIVEISMADGWAWKLDLGEMRGSSGYDKFRPDHLYIDGSVLMYDKKIHDDEAEPKIHMVDSVRLSPTADEYGEYMEVIHIGIGPLDDESVRHLFFKDTYLVPKEQGQRPIQLNKIELVPIKTDAKNEYKYKLIYAGCR